MAEGWNALRLLLQLRINNRPRRRRTVETENLESAKPMAIQITFRNMEPSPAVAARIEMEAAKLDRYYPRITSCRVVVEAPHRQHKSREGFHLGINIDVPRAEIVVRHEPAQRRAMTQNGATRWVKHLEVRQPHNDIYIVIRDAFCSARRQLEDYARRMRGDVKGHCRTPTLRVEKAEQPERRRNL
jgi:ribosome-associated translation inhibitor RaiA